HRLSMFNLLEEYAKASNTQHDTVYIQKEEWGTGEPGGTPLLIKKPDKSLNVLIGKLPQAKKILETKGQDAYNKEADSLIKNFRIIIENAIESVLLTGIVKRHKRQINSRQVTELAKIKKEDCKLIDDLMTKYSRFLHSESGETSGPLPKPEDLKEDFESLTSWIKEFENRPPN
ncbi:MAG: chromosome segregation protein SMC, partial [Oligoflexia bacterium]|nr:chromosome segregation protein SMC [Oligoflexia bacterium]